MNIKSLGLILLLAPLSARAEFIYHDTAATSGGEFNASFLLGNLNNAGHTSASDTEDPLGINESYATKNPPTGAYPVTITLDFTDAVDLTEFYLWNHTNNGAGETRGMKDFTLTFYDGAGGGGSQIGTVYSDSAAQASTASPYAAEVFNFGSTYSGVRSIDLVVSSSHTDSTGFFAIREIGFEAIPEPGSALLLGLGLGTLMLRRQR